MIAIFPMSCDGMTGGIYASLSEDGLQFNAPTLLKASPYIAECRTSDVPLHGIHWVEQGFEFFIHENVRGRMSRDNQQRAPPEKIQKFLCSYSYSWQRYRDDATDRFWFWKEDSGKWFYEGDKCWERYTDPRTSQIWCWNEETGAWFYEA